MSPPSVSSSRKPPSRSLCRTVPVKVAMGRQCTGRTALRYPASVRGREIALVGLLALGAAGTGCHGSGSSTAAREQEPSEAPSVALEQEVGLLENTVRDGIEVAILKHYGLCLIRAR